MSEEITAIVLAAGQSRRMGAFKPLLPFGASTVIKTVLNNLRTAGVTQQIVVLGHRAEDLREHLTGWPLTFALNPETKSPMAVSIACGVACAPLETAAFLIALGDCPAVPSAVSASLVKVWREGVGRISVPEHEGRGGHPVLVGAEFRGALLNLDSTGGLRGFLAANAAQVHRVAVDSPYIRRDLDTWEDYAAVHQELFGHPPPACGIQPNP